MQAHCIDDLRKAAQRRIPKIVFDFVAGGAGHDTGVRENVDAFDRIRLVPRALVDISQIDLSRELFGRRSTSTSSARTSRTHPASATCCPNLPDSIPGRAWLTA